jgi:hypothetical protein
VVKISKYSGANTIAGVVRISTVFFQ